MAQMISKAHKVGCEFGCCHNLSGKAAKRALKKRDRQNALKGES